MTTEAIINAHEAISIPSYSEFKPRLTTKKANAALTETEQRVMAFIGKGLDLGYVSRPLLYSNVVRGLSKPERNALFNLIYNGRAVLARTNCPTSYVLRIAQGD